MKKDLYDKEQKLPKLMKMVEGEMKGEVGMMFKRK